MIVTAPNCEADANEDDEYELNEYITKPKIDVEYEVSNNRIGKFQSKLKLKNS